MLKPLFTLLSALFLLAGCASICTDSHLAERSDVQAFIQKISKRDHFDQTQLDNLFNQVNLRSLSIQNINAPHETTLTWNRYRTIFMTPKRIHEGVAFWQAHQIILAHASQTYGVPPEIIVAIIGVETEYGEVLGHYRVIDALSTLAFNYPPREIFFQNELEQYLLLTRDLQLNPLTLKGSYAGAVGLPQFMPSSYRRLAVSATPGMPADLWHCPDDAILSVAHYFAVNGWAPNQPVVVPATIDGKKFHNFYVIKKYNNSDYYAMAVYQLSQAILQAMQRQGKTC